jgi:TolB-like protein
MNFSATPGSGSRRQPGRIWRTGWLIGLFALGEIPVSGPAAPPPVRSPEGRLENAFAFAAKLAPDFRRVAVLPLAAGTAAGDLPAGCAALTPGLWEQLSKTRKFEVVAVDGDRLRQATGRANWTGTETLPPDFLGFLHREYACDGVLFAELTTYRAYAPLAVGWRFKLVDVRSGQIIWAADELFDAARPAVLRAAQRFEAPAAVWPFRQENWLAVNSPSRFGRYGAATLLDTMPER